MERREGEGVTEFTIRRIRHEILEEAVAACERERLSGESVDEDASYNSALDHAILAIRALNY